MKIAIIGNSTVAPIAEQRKYYQQYIDFFQRSSESSEATVEIYATLFDDLYIEVGEAAFSIFDTHNGFELSQYDAIFFRGQFRSSIDIIATINQYAERNHIRTINNYDTIRDSSKLLQAVNFETIGVPVAKTLLVNRALFARIEESEWIFPCIMKAVHGSHGSDNYLVSSIDEVRKISQKDLTKKFVLQRFIENDGDYRILIIGDEVLTIGRSAQDGSHLNNTSQGGSASLVENTQIPESVINDAHKIATFYQMNIAGVDVLQSKESGEFFFLEVNAQPQLMSGAFIDLKQQLIGKLLDKLSNER